MKGWRLVWGTTVLALIGAPVVVLMVVLGPRGGCQTGACTDYPRSRYSHDEDGQVWFLRPGEGYHLVEGADPDTFEPIPGESGIGYPLSGLGRDRDHFYVQGRERTDVDPRSVRYLGRQYFVAGDRVFFADTLLEGADARTIHVSHVEYASDGHRLYHRGHWIPDADVASLETVAVTGSTSAEYYYLKDARRVYYEDRVVAGARSENFTVIEVQGDAWDNHYGYDGFRYFFKDQPLPAEVADTGRPLSPGAFKLLLADKDFGWHVLFYQGDSLYYHQPYTNEVKALCRRDSTAPLEKLGRGLYRDDRHVYYAWVEEVRKSRGRSGNALWGWRSGLEPLAGVTPDALREVGEAEYRYEGHRLRGTVYEVGERRYFRLDYTAGASLYQAALMRLDQSGKPSFLKNGRQCQAYTKYPDRHGLINGTRKLIQWIGNGFRHEQGSDSGY